MAAESSPEEIRGTLAPGVLPEVLRQLFFEKRTGSLQVAHGADRTSFQFREGLIIDCDPSLPSLHLGEFLVQIGFLGARDRDMCLEIGAISGERMGATLIRHSLLDADRLLQGLSFQIREAVSWALLWPEGRYAFENSVAALGRAGSSPSSGVDPRAVLLDALWGLVGDPVIDQLIGAPTRKIRRTQSERLAGLDLSLNATDGFVLSRLDAPCTVAEVLQLSPYSEEETKAAIAGLICAGVAELEASQRARSATEEVRRTEVVQLAVRLHGSDPYQVLGLKPTAVTEEIRSTYVSLLKVCDPAAASDPEMRSLLRRMTELLTSAFRQLERIRAAPCVPEDAPPVPAGVAAERAAQGSEQGGAAPPPVDPAMAIEMADAACEQGNTHEARSILQEAIPNLTGRARRVARVRLCRILLSTPNGEKVAMQELKLAVSEDPGNLEAYALLGHAHRELGQVALAASAFKKILTLDPRNGAARAALNELEALEPKGQAQTPSNKPKRPSLVRRLFGR